MWCQPMVRASRDGDGRFQLARVGAVFFCFVVCVYHIFTYIIFYDETIIMISIVMFILR